MNFLQTGTQFVRRGLGTSDCVDWDRGWGTTSAKSGLRSHQCKSS
jgi:hypothetical protein